MKLQVVLEVLREEQTVNEIAAKHGVHPNMVARWKQEFLEKAPDVFKRGMSDAERELREKETHVTRLEALLKMLYLVTQDVMLKWTGRIHNWGQILLQLAVFFPEKVKSHLK